MRVLIVHPNMSACVGSMKIVENLSRCLGQRGIDNSVMTLAPCAEDSVGRDGSRRDCPEKHAYSRHPESAGLGEAMSLIKEIVALNAMLRKKAGDYDVVNLYNFPSTWAAYGLKKPVVWMFDEPGDIRSNLRQSLVLKAMYGGGVSIDKYIINNFVDTICVADETNRERVLRRYGREPHLIPYGMDIGPSCPKKNEEMRHLFGLDGRFVVFHPGMISAQKNQLESLKAVWRLHEKIKDIVLVLTGVSHDGYRKTIEAFIKEKKIEKHVVFLGHLSEESSRHLYMASDVAVFPEQSAGGWLYPFEVISSGAPIVASKAFAASSLIGREKLGLVTDDLASAIEYIFLHPQKSRRTSERAFEWARRNFGWEHFTGQMVDVFDSVIH